MSPASEEDNIPDLGDAIQSALANASDEHDEDSHLDVVSNSGLSGGGAAADKSGELPYVVLLKAAVSMVKTGELSMEEYVEGVMKLDVIADNALKVYSIPAIKKDLPGKLTEHQNSLMGALEAEIHRLKEGLGVLLSYPETRAIGDLETGLETSVSAMNAMAVVQKAADAEREAILQREQEDKERRAQKAAEVES
jgi:hypothetical protein